MIRYINRHHWKAVRIAALICLGGIGGYRWGHASDDMMVRVERALVQAGYTQAAGYSLLTPPTVEVNEFIDGGGWGSYRPGRIEISSRQPAGCIPVTLAHELSHDLMVRMGILARVPNERVMAELERAARVAEAAIDADDFSPNCTMKRGAL